MSDKPSLYVVEKREVVILVVLFVLVTVISFTLGVRYGETVGKKLSQEQRLAEKEHGEESAEAIGGTLGKGSSTSEASSHAQPATPAHSDHGEHGLSAEKKEAKAEEGGHPEAKAVHGEHGAAKPAEPAGHSPEAAAKSAPHGQSSPRESTDKNTDKNSDEYLLNALKEAGVEPPGGKAPQEAKLPERVKKIYSGNYVIQVGSHPTHNEAEAQVRLLRSKRLQAEILPAFKDRQGEWHRVVVGSFKTKRDAEKEAAGLKGRGTISSYFVWRLP